LRVEPGRKKAGDYQAFDLVFAEAVVMRRAVFLLSRLIYSQAPWLIQRTIFPGVFGSEPIIR
jgi:hypothetical protein